MSETETGRAKGAGARAASLKPERRSEIARQAALARWTGVGRNPRKRKRKKKGGEP